MTSSNYQNNSKRKSILFFGRHDCRGTKEILNLLNKMDVDLFYVESKNRNEMISEDFLWWSGDYILCFRSLFILPKELILRARTAAINFHPAPPEYPGSGCINFALYDNAQEYGVTAHLMNEKIDNGRILEVRRFPIGKLDDLESLLSRTHRELTNLCLDFINYIDTCDENTIQDKFNKKSTEQWHGEAKK